MSGKTVLAFGTFDGLDAEHRFFLEQAAALGDRLVVGIARDAHVQELKSKLPYEHETLRAELVKSVSCVSEVHLCDEALGSFEIINQVNPDVIAIGYDQDALEQSIQAWAAKQGRMIACVRLPKCPQPDKEVHIVVGLVVREGKLLMIQRKDKLPMWDKKWEFPGGKIEPGEPLDAAMQREIKEETGLNVEQYRFLGTHMHDWHLPDKIMRVRIHCYQCRVGAGDVRHEERAAYQTAWATIDEALEYDSLDANDAILRRFYKELHEYV